MPNVTMLKFGGITGFPAVAFIVFAFILFTFMLSMSVPLARVPGKEASTVSWTAGTPGTHGPTPGQKPQHKEPSHENGTGTGP